MAGDIKVFMASANQARYLSSDLIVGSVKVWELKSVVSRLLSYFIYKIACLFVPYSSYAFEVVSKAVYSVLLILAVWGSMRLVFGKSKRKVLQYTMICSALLMAAHSIAQMQVEMTASVLALLAFALYLNAVRDERLRILKLILSGVLIGSIFYLKSVLILLSVSVVAAICIYLAEHGLKLSFRRMMTVVAGSVLSLAVIAVLILLINPSEFREILNAGAYQGTFFSSPFQPVAKLKACLEYHVSRPLFIPAVMLGFVCLLLNLYVCVREKKGALVFYHIVLWFMPFLFILLSDVYFPYHFAAYLFPVIVEVMDTAVRPGRARKFIAGAAAAAAAVWYILMFSFPSANVQAYIRADLEAYEKTDALLAEADYEKDQSVMYLDDGSGAYALGNPSWLKHFFPLPLQRIDESSDMDVHVESLEKALAFEGKYISVSESWFFQGYRYQNLREKIDRDYRLIGSYYIFLPPKSFSPSDATLDSLDLYERKQEP